MPGPVYRVFKNPPGETWNIGGNSKRTNLDAVLALTGLLDELRPRKDGKSCKTQIEFVKDRPGHDGRYAMDTSKIRENLGFTLSETFETGLLKTLKWYLDNPGWVETSLKGASLKRLGLGERP